jgi:hypothetical protein
MRAGARAAAGAKAGGRSGMGVPPTHGYGAIDDGDKAGARYSGALTGPHLCFAKLLHRERIMLGTMRVGS